MQTRVAIVGAGPAGLLLGRMLDRAGIDNVILERRDRAYCEARIRAGVLEQGTVDLLASLDVDARLRAEGLVHGGIELRFGADSSERERIGHRIAMDALTGGRSVTIYGQTEVVKDLIAARLDDGGPLLFEAGVEAIEGFRDGGRPRVVAADAAGERLEVDCELVAALRRLPRSRARRGGRRRCGRGRGRRRPHGARARLSVCAGSGSWPRSHRRARS